MNTLDIQSASLSSLPDHSRIWIYTADRVLNAVEQATFRQSLEEFCAGWQSHGSELASAGELFEGCLLVLAVDERSAGASGCSIDKSVRWLKEWGVTHGVDFFNRHLVVYREQEVWRLTGVQQFWAMRKAGIVTEETEVVDTLCKDLGQWKTAGVVPFTRSWHQEVWGR